MVLACSAFCEYCYSCASDVTCCASQRLSAHWRWPLRMVADSQRHAAVRACGCACALVVVVVGGGGAPLRQIVVPGFMQLGADLQWLSAFPGEAEILYPPLTYLKPTGKAERFDAESVDGERVSFTVVELQPTLGA